MCKWGAFRKGDSHFYFERRKEMSEKMAGIFAINVVNEKDYMEIDGVKILKKEFNGEKVLAA